MSAPRASLPGLISSGDGDGACAEAAALVSSGAASARLAIVVVSSRRIGSLSPLELPVRGLLQHTSSLPGMILRLSSLFVRTLREDPVDAEVPSHRLLVRAGYIRRAAPGVYSWLPLGLRVLRNIERIIREEMDAFGAQELQFPALLPREPYEASGRWTEYGDNIFRLKDRKGGDYLLGPTHEEMFTLVVKDLYSSYKDLPLSIYQIQNKYRDEARPRAGLLRGREFVMKDSYSFDIDDAGLERSYQQHREAYIRIFDRLGFDYVIVKATSGAMGGSKSEEFLARADVGEDTYVRCTNCDYAANVEAVTVRPPAPVAYDDAPAAHAEQTPDTPTIETLVDHLNLKFPREDRPWEAGDTLKNVVVVFKHPDGTREPVAIGVPGDRDVDAKRLNGQLEPIEVEPMSEEEFAKHPSPGQGLHRPRRAGGEERLRHPLPRRPPRRRGHPLGHRRRRRRQPRHRPGGRPRLHARRHHRGRRGLGRRPLPELSTRGRSSRLAVSRWDTSSSSAASTPTRWACRCSTRTASSSPSPWAPTASDLRVGWPPSPRTPSTRSACAGREPSRRPTSTSSPPARTTRSSRPPAGWPTSCPRAASRCSTTTGPRSAPA